MSKQHEHESVPFSEPLASQARGDSDGHPFRRVAILHHPMKPASVALADQIEDYLRGVVPWEIGRPDWDALEAVKAQAIAARTYTIRHLGRWEELGFDVYADVRDQVYRGRTGTAEITDRAVKETRDEVLVLR